MPESGVGAMASLMNAGLENSYRNSPIQQMMNKAKIQEELGQAGLVNAETRKTEQDIATQARLQADPLFGGGPAGATVNQSGTGQMDPIATLNARGNALMATGNPTLIGHGTALLGQASLMQERQEAQKTATINQSLKYITDPDIPDALRIHGYNTLADMSGGKIDHIDKWDIGEEDRKKADAVLDDKALTLQQKLQKVEGIYLGTKNKESRESIGKVMTTLEAQAGREGKEYGDLGAFKEYAKATGKDISTPAKYDEGYQAYLKLKPTASSSVKLTYAGPMAEATVEGKEKGQANSPDSFNSWTAQAKELTFRENLITGKGPVSVAGLGGNDRKAYAKAYAQWQVDQGLTAGQVAAMRTDFKAADRSVSKQKYNYDVMNSFVINLDSQLAKIDEQYKKLPRLDARFANIPIAEVRKRVTGSGDEAAAKAYLIEISNEVGKLSTGSAASIRELSTPAQEQWKKIHDEKFSYNDMMKVLKATHDLGHGRLASTQKAMDMTREEIDKMGGGGGSPATPATSGGTAGKTIKRTGIHDGKKVVEYSDGSIEYAN